MSAAAAAWRDRRTGLLSLSCRPATPGKTIFSLTDCITYVEIALGNSLQFVKGKIAQKIPMFFCPNPQ